jgi:hypothetical protein
MLYKISSANIRNFGLLFEIKFTEEATDFLKQA